MGSILDKKVDLKVFFAGPFMAIYDTFLNLFNRKKEITNGTNIVYDVRQGKPITIRSERVMTQYEQMYGKFNTNYGTSGNARITDSQFALDAVKAGIKREICDEIMRSDLFEWSIDETAAGTRVGARIIVNKF